MKTIRDFVFVSSLLALALQGCELGGTPPTLDRGLLLATAALGQNDDGSPKPLPARLGILTREDGEWQYRFIEDPDSNVFHKAMAYRGGILTFGGTRAIVKLWRPDGSVEKIWEADFGGSFSRMRDAEVGDLYGDGAGAIAVATHDQGVVAVLRPEADGGFAVDELHREEDTIVHEIEIGDLNDDGVLEVYATPTEPNRMDGSAQPGKVVRYVPQTGEGPVEVAELGDRHAKEILVADVDVDGRDELYVSLEAISGGQVEIRRYGSDSTEGETIATLSDRLCRFLTAGDVEGDGKKELVAATHKAGLWLLRFDGERGSKRLIDSESSGFEHASILLDLDEDGADELYVASDDHGEVRRYLWNGDGFDKEVLVKFEDDLGRFTWNITAAPVDLLPPAPVAADEARSESFR